MADWDEAAPVEIEEAPVGAPLLDTQEIKVFNKWSLNDVEVSDISLVVRLYLLFVLSNQPSLFRTTLQSKTRAPNTFLILQADIKSNDSVRQTFPSLNALLLLLCLMDETMARS